MNELRNFDLNLLIAFKHLLEERSVSRSAEKLFISQSAMSHVLQRLRQQLDDPVLIKTPRGMRPTQRALDLFDPICAVLKNVESIVQPPEQFSPETSQRRFVIATSDYFECTLLRALCERLNRTAPDIELHVKLLGGASAETCIEEGEVDLVIALSVVSKSTSYLRRETLFNEGLAIVVRRNHPIFFQSEISLEQYLSSRHLSISYREDGTDTIDDLLEQSGDRRKISVIIPNLLSAVSTVASTDLVLTAPRHVGEHFARLAPVKMMPVPIEIPDCEVTMAWHPLKDKEPAHIWLRQQILGAVGGPEN
ncbi:MAG: LysR family transcriptional regulator [Methylocystis sp.]